MYNNILFSTLESQKEKFFNHKCRSLLKYYSKERLLEFIGRHPLFIDLFQNDLLSCDDINYILLKKYFVSNHYQNSNTSFLDYCLGNLDIQCANILLTENIELRNEVFGVFLDNIDIPNKYLAIEKAYTKGYDKVANALNAIDSFYKNKKEVQYASALLLKKEL